MNRKIITDHSILIFKYTLGQLDAYRLERYGNTQIKGCSLRGKISDVENEKIKLHLDIDRTFQSHTYYYPYKPVTGNIMYSTPEIGESVELYFPDEFEGNGFIIHGIKKKDSLNKKTKFMRTPNNKYIDLSPHGIALKAEAEEHENISAIGLTDESSVSIQTGLDIKLKARGKIIIKSGLSSMIRAENFIVLRQKNTINQISIFGNDIISEAEKYRILPKKRKIEKGKRTTSQRIAFQGIENNLYLLGAFSPGNSSPLEQYALAAIPVCAFPQNPQIANSIGLHAGRKR